MGRTLEAAARAKEALTLHFHQGDPFGSGLRQKQSGPGAVIFTELVTVTSLWEISKGLIIIPEH